MQDIYQVFKSTRLPCPTGGHRCAILDRVPVNNQNQRCSQTKMTAADRYVGHKYVHRVTHDGRGENVGLPLQLAVRAEFRLVWGDTASFEVWEKILMAGRSTEILTTEQKRVCKVLEKKLGSSTQQEEE